MNRLYIRRLVKAGQASHTISLPKAWVEKNRLAKGSIVHIKEISDTELRITPNAEQKQDARKTALISVDNKPLDTIQREITAAYVNNASTIDLVGKDVGSYAKEIRRMLHDFVALEIAEQTPTKISAQDLLNLEEISVQKSLARMDIIVRTMLADCMATLNGTDLSESVMLRDYDVNRLYFLLVRLLKSALTSPGMATRLKLSPSNVLTCWMLTHHLEQLADTIKTLCRECAKTLPKKRKSIKDVLAELEQDYREAMKAVHEKNKQLADSVARKRTERQNAIENLENPGIAYNCSAITTLVSDIARLVIDAED